nr:hypothetical protein [uncultured Rhodopila sp.]
MPFDTNTDQPRRVEKFRFFVFTCRKAASDFRLPLAEALGRHYETYYIWLKRRPIVTGPGRGDAPVEMNLLRFLLFMLGFRPDDKVNIYFNSTNTYFPGIMLFLRCFTTAGVWCLDMHDDLRYHNTGLTRLREALVIRLLRACSDVIVNAAPMLAELFPRSRHLGNASHIRPLDHGAETKSGILVIASFDERFDVDFLSRLAALRPEMQFHLHGWTRPDDPVTAEKIRILKGRHANIHYHGAYTTEDLPAILGAYRVSLAPYLANTLITRYIDPLRYYHCLNAGLEVVSTDIPQARHMSRWIHVVRDEHECAATLAAVQAGTLAKQSGYTPITWEQRVDRLVEIVCALPRTKALGARRLRGRSVEMTAAEAGSGSAGD